MLKNSTTEANLMRLKKCLAFFTYNIYHDFSWMSDSEVDFGDRFVEHLGLQYEKTTTKGLFYDEYNEIYNYKPTSSLKAQFNKNYSLFIEHKFIEEIEIDKGFYRKSDRFSQWYNTKYQKDKYKPHDLRFKLINYLLETEDDFTDFKDFCIKFPNFSQSDLVKALKNLVRNNAITFADQGTWITGGDTKIKPGIACPTMERRD